MPERGAAALARRTRLTYLLFFRVVVVSLLLAARLAEEWSAPEGAPSLAFSAGLALTILAYGSAIAFSLWLRRAKDGSVDRIAISQIVFDLLAATVLVHLTGGAESQLAFTYLIVVAGAGLLFVRGAINAALGAVALLVLLALLRQLGVLPLVGQLRPSPARELVRALALNSVAIIATGALGARLAVELARAGASLVQKSAQFEDLAMLYADVVRSLSSGLVTLGVDGRVATANQAALAILGLDEDRVLGRALAQSVPEMGPLLDSPRAVRREEIAFLDASKKPRRLGVTVSPLVDSRDRQIGQIVAFQDLTELRQMEEAIGRQKRLAAIGRLAAGIAHEIRNPLAAISGSIELLVASGVGESSQESRELASIVQRETERLNGLITELLEFARPRRTELAPLDLVEAVSELVQVYRNDRRLSDTRIEVTSEGTVRVQADADQLRQVMWNLLRNAAEAAPDSIIRVRITRNGVIARLTISDDGPGIDAEHLSRVFEPFFSTKDGGTGLGLPTVQRIIEEHGGTIELSRGADRGTIATVTLPLLAS